MDRHKCLICGKVRFSKYMLQSIDLQGAKRWVCSRPVGYNQNYIKIGSVNYLHSPCHLLFLKSQFDALNRQITNYQFSKIQFPLFQEIKQQKNVTPELTFLLQL